MISSSGGDSDSEEKVASEIFLAVEEGDSSKDRRSESLRHEGRHEGLLGVKFRKLVHKHPGLKDLCPINPLFDRVLSYRPCRLKNDS